MRNHLGFGFRPLTFATILSTLLIPLRGNANVVGSDAQNFNPITSGLDFVSVQSSETLETGMLNVGLFINHAKNTFPYYPQVGQASSRTETDNSLLGGDFNLGIGLGKSWDAGVSFPLILKQQISNLESIGHYSSNGNTEVRVNTKYRLVGDQSQGMAVVASANFNRISDNPYLGSGGGPIYNLEFAADTTISNFAVALNLGYRWRNPGVPVANSGIEPMPNQWLGSVAGSYLIDAIDTKVVGEILTAYPEHGQLKGATDREYTVMEALLAFKVDVSSSLSFHMGGGAGLAKGVSAPDYRIYSGLNYTLGSLFGSKPVQTDPYFQDREPTRFQSRRPRPAPVAASSEVVPSPVADTSEAAAPRTAKQAVAATPSTEVTKPSQSVDSIGEVKVFNRGSFNHIVINNIFFEEGTYSLMQESAQYIQHQLIAGIRTLHGRRAIATIVVEGHTDSVGKPDENAALSRRRAGIVANYLRKYLGLNIPIQAVGLGETSPIADNGNFQGRILNNRVEFKLLYQKSPR